MSMTITQSVGLHGVNIAQDVLAVQTRLIALGFTWLEANTVMESITIQTIQLFQAIKNGLNTVRHPRNDGRIDVGGDTLKWLQAVNAPRWQKMPAGSAAAGFINDELAQENDQHDFGVSWLADTLQSAGETYRADFLQTHPHAALIHLNDISLPQGGRTPAHATHQAGLCCDIRLPRTNGSVGGITVTSAAYDRTAMRAMLSAFRQQILTSRILLNDPPLVSEDLCSTAPGHDDHVHVEIKPPARIM
jgi:hypothetical protein